jgi:hypothetical protein
LPFLRLFWPENAEKSPKFAKMQNPDEMGLF